LTQSSTCSGSRQRFFGLVGQRLATGRCAAFDLEAAGQRAFGAATALHAGLHHVPDGQQAGAISGAVRQCNSFGASPGDAPTMVLALRCSSSAPL
jgi:hypothetical protein